MENKIKITNLNDDIIDTYFKLQQGIHDYFNYKEDWKVIPLEDTREYYWFVDEDSNIVRFADSVDLLLHSDGAYYEDEIYTQRFLTKFVYRADNFTMISVDTHTDGNKFLRIFDNNKEVEAIEEEE